MPRASQIGDVATAFGVLVVLPLWWLLHSGYSWKRRLGWLAGTIAFLAASFFLLVRKVELVTDERRHFPRLEFRWEPTTEARLLAYQQGQASRAMPALNAHIGPEDSATYRGPYADGTVRHLRIADDWHRNPPRVLWRHPCGGGYSGICAAGNVVITLEQRGEQETVVCYDQQSGLERWNHTYKAHFQHFVGDGPRATPTLAENLVVSLGATGELLCLNVQDGSERWRLNILEDNAAANLQWGTAASPLVVGKLVIVQAGVDPKQSNGQAVVAYNLHDGKQVWARGGHVSSYSSPQLVTLHGQQTLLIFDAAGLAGLDPVNGTERWRHPWRTMMDTNTMQPLVISERRIFLSSESDRGSAMIEVTAPPSPNQSWQVQTVWENRRFSSRYACPVATGSAIFGLSHGLLTCLDIETGERRWKDGRFGSGQLLLVGDRLLITSDRGDLALVAADLHAYRELSRITALEGKTWNMPAISGRRLFMRNQAEMTCIELPTQP